jgi:hypothetical protein
MFFEMLLAISFLVPLGIAVAPSRSGMAFFELPLVF